jgi:hypothetical protein
LKLKRKKGRKQCRINCSEGCGPGRRVAVATVQEGDPPIFTPGIGKGIPICKQCARLWYERWKIDQDRKQTQ